MPAWKRTHHTVFALVLGLHAVSADLIPTFTVDEMCDRVSFVVEGTYLGRNRVRVSEVLKAPPHVDRDLRAVEVEHLREHNRILFRGEAIGTTKLMLFLVPGNGINTWRSVGTTDQEGQWGSSGVIWFDDLTCYGYLQLENPGPLQLRASRPGLERWVPSTVTSLRADIRSGLANSREWRRTLAIQDPSKKAQALARYLLKSTSPRGDKGSYRHKVRRPMGALGKHAVPALIQTLRTAPVDEELNRTVLTLYDIGLPSARALTDLVALLDQPERASTCYLLSALGSTGHPRAVSYLKQYLGSEDERLARAAREALAKHRELRRRMVKENEQGDTEQEDGRRQ